MFVEGQKPADIMQQLESETEFIKFVQEHVQSEGNAKITMTALDGLIADIPATRIVEIIKGFKGGRWGGTILHWAALQGQTELIDKILKRVSIEQRFDLIAAGNKDSTNVLQEAAGNSRPDTLKYLLDAIPHEFSIHLIWSECMIGDTAVHRCAFSACSVYNATVMDMVLYHTPDAKQLLFHQNRRGFTPLHYAVFYMENDAVRKIMSRMATDSERQQLIKIKEYVVGYTALHRAAMNSNFEVIRSMLEPCSPDIRKQLLALTDSNGFTPKQLADRNNRNTNYQILQYYEGLMSEAEAAAYAPCSKQVPVTNISKG